MIWKVGFCVQQEVQRQRLVESKIFSPCPLASVLPAAEFRNSKNSCRTSGGMFFIDPINPKLSVPPQGRRPGHDREASADGRSSDRIVKDRVNKMTSIFLERAFSG